MAEQIGPDDPVDAVDGVGSARRDDLEEAGYADVHDLQRADLSELSDVLPPHIARQIKEQVGDSGAITSIAAAKEKAQKIPGAKAKTVRMSDGRQRTKVLELIEDKSTPGAHITVRKG